MRALFINLSHPGISHVSGVRIPSFAQAMAQRGHQIVLLTKTLGEDDAGTEREGLVRALNENDCSKRLHVTVKPEENLFAKLRAGRFPRPLSKVITAWAFQLYGGVYADWSKSAAQIEPILAERFRPEVVWATFLPSDAYVIAQRLATLARCPWVADLKDAWTHRLPIGLRKSLAQRFRYTRFLTSNSRFHGEQGERWFKRKVVTLYDGIAEEFLQVNQGPTANGFRITLVGGTYGEEALAGFLRGLGGWVLSLPEKTRHLVRFTYAGSDEEKVRTVLERLFPRKQPCDSVIWGYLPLARLAEICGGAAVNTYLWLPGSFHHKLLELLACGRPLIAFPGENEESKELASCLGGDLYICRNEKELDSTLSELWITRNDRSKVKNSTEVLRSFTWPSRVAFLEEILTEVVNRDQRFNR